MSIDTDLIELMRTIPFPVVVVTMKSGDTIRGVTIGSFTSLSMNPSLVSFNLQKDSRAHELMESVEAFVIHFPGAGQEEICTRFARPDQRDREQFEEIEYQLSERGVPLLEGVAARVYCAPEHRFEAGDHSMIVGRVTRIEQLDNTPALLYLNGEYRTLDGNA